MRIVLTKEHEMIRKVVREFAETVIKPEAAELDLDSTFPMDTFHKMADLGIYGVGYDRKYGGSGGDTLASAIVMEELSRVSAAHGTVYGAQAGLGSGPIYFFGTEEQKLKWLPDNFSGKKISSFALTEPNAGSDAAGQQTIAVRSGDKYIVNGSKMFITNAGVADQFITAVMTDKSKGTKGISMLFIERSMPGVSTGKHEDKMGIRASSTSEIVFQDVEVPAENLIGVENRGFVQFMKELDVSRICIAAQAVGIAQGALEEATKYMKERKQFGRTLSKFQGLQWMLADMATKVEAARLLTYQAAAMHTAGENISKAAAMAKMYASRVAVEVASDAVQIHGGYGYIKDYPVERMYRDAKITEIYEGTSQVQKMVIASKLL